MRNGGAGNPATVAPRTLQASIPGKGSDAGVRELAITVKHGGAVAFHAEQAEVLSTANTSRTNEAKVKISKLQAKANEVWKRHPTFSAKSVAGIIAGEENPNTVRRKIRKPK